MSYNLKKFKLAKILTTDLPEVIKLLDNIESALKPYIRYKPIAKVVREIRTSKAVFQAHLQEAEVVVKSKGVEVGQ